MASPTPLKVLYHIHPDLYTLDLAGPLELLTSANYPSGGRIFSSTVTATTEYVTTEQNLEIRCHISVEDAYASLADYDVLIIPGGGSPGVLGGQTEPIHLIKAFSDLPKRDDGRVRTLLSVCTGSLFVAAAGVLDGLVATTHANYYPRLREVAAAQGETKVVEERFVVNKVNEEKGLRVVTSGGVTCGLDSCLWLIGETAGLESKELSAHRVQYAWREGLVL